MTKPLASSMCQLLPQFGWLAKVLWPTAVLFTALALKGVAFGAEVRFSEAPTTAQQAWETLFERREKVTRFMACGDEVTFLDFVNHIDTDPGHPVPHIIGKMLWLLLNPNTATGKQEPPPPAGDIVKHHEDPEDPIWGQPDSTAIPFIRIQATVPEANIRVPGVDCESPADIPGDKGDECNKLPPNDQLDCWIANTNLKFSEQHEVTTVGCSPPFCLNLPQCNTILQRVINTDTAKYVVTPSCMRRQVNAALWRIKVNGQPGTDGAPCHIFGKNKGDWDMDVRDLTRILYLDMRNSERHILFEEVARHVSDDLLTLDGPPGLPSYSLFECGNQENSTGSPQERAAERSWLDDTMDSVGDVFDWLWKRLLLLVALLATAGLLAAVIGALSAELAGIVAAMIAVIGAMVAFGRVPETENHQLMIETSRYLKNQEIILRLKDSRDDPGRYEGDQIFVKHVLMSKFQDILKNDFQEYNSRPYSRLSLLAIQNIAQFADDPELQDAARMVLQFSMAKAAIGSYRGRRLVPYRRHMEALRSTGFKSLFDNVSNGDHLIPLMMFFTGQTQQLPNNSVPTNSFDQMIYYASGMMGPNPLVPDNIIMGAAIEKSRRYEQRIAHAGAEIYSGGDGWLVTAGGIETGPANFFIAPIKLPFVQKLLPNTPLLFKDDDRGAAWPTTLMLAAAVVKEKFDEDQKPMEDFIRIEGLKIIHQEESEQDGRNRATDPNVGGMESITSIRRDRGFWRGQGISIRNHKMDGFDVPDQSVETFEGNLCVGMGFACGFNLEFPVPLDGSRVNCGDTRPGNWTFFDTNKCYPETVGRPGATRVLIATFRDKCPHPTLVSNKCRNFGLFEVISFNDPALAKFEAEERYENFIRLVLEENQSIGVSRGSVLSGIDVEAHGTYVAVKQNERGQRVSIHFQAELSEDSSLSRIDSIDGRERPSQGSWKNGEGDFINGDSRGRVEIGWPAARPGEPPPRHLILDLSYYRPDTFIQNR